MNRAFPRLLVLTVVVALFAAGCGDDSSSTGSAGSGATTTEAPVTIRLGYFPNITHASALVGVQKGIFTSKLGNDKLETKTFNAGGDATTALLSGAIDASYLGPNAAVNAFSKSNGAISIISGATSGGAALVVKPSITSVDQLKGKKLADPQLGATQDTALRYYLSQHGFTTDTTGGGDVSILPQDNATTLQSFQSGAIDGAWVPEPWATRLGQEGGGHVLVDERTLWPKGQFSTTVLIVANSFLKAHPDAVKRLLEGQVAANQYLADHTAEAQQAVSDGIAAITGKPLKLSIIQAAWPNMTFTDDPLESSIATSTEHAVKLGLVKATKLDGIYDLTPLNEVLTAAGKAKVGS